MCFGLQYFYKNIRVISKLLRLETVNDEEMINEYSGDSILDPQLKRRRRMLLTLNKIIFSSRRHAWKKNRERERERERERDTEIQRARKR